MHGRGTSSIPSVPAKLVDIYLAGKLRASRIVGLSSVLARHHPARKQRPVQPISSEEFYKVLAKFRSNPEVSTSKALAQVS